MPDFLVNIIATVILLAPFLIMGFIVLLGITFLVLLIILLIKLIRHF